MNPPAYSPVRPQTEHVYQLTNNSGSWATLKVLSRARKANQMPIFLEGDMITGSFSLTLDSEDHIMAITVELRGQIVSSGHFSTACVFLDELKTLWCKEMGDPRHPSSTRFSGKLSGSYLWAFSFALPSHVTLNACSTQSGLFRLPEAFLERHSQISIQYDIEAHIVRSRFRVNSKLQTIFVYIPGTRPSPPSLLHQLAYLENRPLPDPSADPEGWHQLEAFTVRGKVFNTRPVDVRCLFYLAKPLCYTRGSPLPCAVTISSSDSQAVDLLASPRSVNVHLRRSVRSRKTSTYLSQTPISQSSCIVGGFKDFVQDVGEAVWWTCNNPILEHEVTSKSLMGEILLPVTLKPSCLIGKFCIEYSVDVLPFKSPVFTILEIPVVQQTVEIATLFARCPRPRSYAPPNNGTYGNQ